ncbi:MAG: ABC transporter substrate-binding protein [Dongiaceae bacterium]
MLTSMSTRRLLIAAGLVLFGWTAAPAVQASADPASFIEEVSNKAITEMAPASTETDQERAAKLKPLLEQYFDMPAIAKYMLGAYWRKATPEEQTSFTSVLTDFLALAYGKRFATYTGHEMDIGRVRDEGDGRTTVFSTVKLPSGDPARVDWTIEQDGDTYKIADVKVEGLSLADTHRQEFASVISSNGGSVSKLIEVLKKKVGNTASATN